MFYKIRNILIVLLIVGCLFTMTVCTLSALLTPAPTATPASTATLVPTPTDTRITATLPIGVTITLEPTGTATLVPTMVIPLTPTPSAVPPTPVPAAPTPAPPAAVCDCSGDVYNCGDFANHTQAQTCHNYCVSVGRGDVHKLDRDNDDVACESLP